MYAKYGDPELARQLFDNAITAVAASFLGLAALVAIIAAIFVARECLSLLVEPERPHRDKMRA